MQTTDGGDITRNNYPIINSTSNSEPKRVEETNKDHLGQIQAILKRFNTDNMFDVSFVSSEKIHKFADRRAKK